MKKLLTILFLFFAVWSQAQTSPRYPIGWERLPNTTELANYWGTAQAIRVMNTDSLQKDDIYFNCPTCPIPDPNIISGVGTRRWKKYTSSERDSLALAAILTINAGNNITISQSASQTLDGNPEWTIVGAAKVDSIWWVPGEATFKYTIDGRGPYNIRDSVGTGGGGGDGNNYLVALSFGGTFTLTAQRSGLGDLAAYLDTSLINKFRFGAEDNIAGQNRYFDANRYGVKIDSARKLSISARTDSSRSVFQIDSIRSVITSTAYRRGDSLYSQLKQSHDSAMLTVTDAGTSTLVTHTNSKILVKKDSIKLFPSLGKLYIDTLALGSSNFALVWDSTGNATNSRGRVSYRTILDNTNAGSGYRLLKPNLQSIKTLFTDLTASIDSTTNTDGLTIRVDTSVISTKANVTNVYNILNAKGDPNTNLGSGYRWLVPGSQGIKTAFSDLTIKIDSSSNTNGLTLKVDSTVITTRADRDKLKDTLNATLVPKTRTLTINGTTYDLSDNRTWSVGTVTTRDRFGYPSEDETAGENRTFDVGSSYTVHITQSGNGSNDVFAATSYNGVAVTGTGDNVGTGVRGNSGGGTGVLGYSLTGTAVNAISSTSGTALLAEANHTGLAARLHNVGSTNTVLPAVVIENSKNTSVADGLGTALDFKIGTTNGTVQLANEIASVWSTATHATRTSRLEFYNVTAGNTTRTFAIAGNGRLTADKYGSGTFGGTASYTLGVDGDGNIVEFSPSGVVESDPVAINKTITLNEVGVINIVGTASQILDDDPTWDIEYVGGLDDQNDVLITSVANNQLLKYNSSNSKWENWTPNFLTTPYTASQGLTMASNNTRLGGSLDSTATILANQSYVRNYGWATNPSAGRLPLFSNQDITWTTNTTQPDGYGYNAFSAALKNTFNGTTQNLGSGAINAAGLFVAQVASTATSTVTVDPSDNGGIRTLSGITTYIGFLSNSNTATISHLAGIEVLPLQPPAAETAENTLASVTNYYGLLLNNSDEYENISVTNRWGVYQEGATDKNFFGGKVELNNVAQDNSNTKILTIDGNDEIEWRDVSTISGGSYTDEQAQDAVGAMIANTATINLTYTDGTPELKADLNATLKSNYDAAYTDRLKWDGGATGLTAATGRTSLGGTTVGQNIFTASNPSAVRWIRVNADNTITFTDAATTASDIGALTDVPTLDDVLNAGNTSTLAATVGELNIGSSNQAQLRNANLAANRVIQMPDRAGTLVMKVNDFSANTSGEVNMINTLSYARTTNKTFSTNAEVISFDSEVVNEGLTVTSNQEFEVNVSGLYEVLVVGHATTSVGTAAIKIALEKYNGSAWSAVDHSTGITHIPTSGQIFQVSIKIQVSLLAGEKIRVVGSAASSSLTAISASDDVADVPSIIINMKKIN